MASDEQAVAEAFTNHYYPTFCQNRAALASLYTPQSMLTFEGQRFIGQQAIMEKFGSLQFGKCMIHVSTKDAQPSTSGGILVFVTGQLQVEGETNLLKMSQVFHLVPVSGNYVVSNELFRLNYG